MHILLIHQAFASHDNAGGTRHFELANYCVEQGSRFTIIASDVDYLSGTKKDTSIHGNDQIRIQYAKTLPALHKNFVWRVLSFFSYMFSSLWKGLMIQDVDVVMGTSPPIFQAVSACLVAKLKRKPFLLEIRDLWPEFAVDMGVLKSKFLIYLSRQLESWLYARADHLLVNSPAYKTYLLNKNIPESKVSFVPNGVDSKLFENGHGWELPFEVPNVNQYHVAYTGALGMANDLEVLLQAAKQLTKIVDIHFWFIGDGKERINLEKLSKDLSLQNVTFTGSISKKYMPQILNKMNLCVATLKDIPMFSTTYPNKVFDYMAAGKPSLLAIDGVIRKVIEDADAGYFTPPGDSSALANKILEFYQNPSHGIELGENGKRYVKENFERKDQAEQFYQLLNGCKK